jgi:hypothetical protein
MKTVYINGKDENLPKSSGDYFIQFKNGSKLLYHFQLEKRDSLNDVKHWKAKVEWWIDLNESCNHVIGAVDESGKCLKCGEIVSKTINVSQLPAVTDEEETKSILEPIQNALYATIRLSQDNCIDLSVGILEYIRDAGFKVVRNSLIPASCNTVKDEENKVKFLINDVCKWEDSPGYDSLEKTLSDKYFVRFKNSISSAPDINQGGKGIKTPQWFLNRKKKRTKKYNG